MNGKAIMVTGAAGTGKSTLVAGLVERIRPSQKLDYGRLLLDHLARRTGKVTSYEELRRDSGLIVTGEDVAAVDERVISELPILREKANVFFDSHPVTKESYGFRVTPYSVNQVHLIGFNAILVLVAKPERLLERIAQNPQGRPAISAFDAQFQLQLQASVAVTYAMICSIPCHIIDTSDLRAGEVLDIAVDLLRACGL
jgi:adenylate kinase